MPKPKVWNNSNALVSALARDWKGRGPKLHNSASDWESTIRGAVAANTFRAFQNLPLRPSRVFREWALDALVTRNVFESLKGVRTQDEYDKWLESFVIDFRNHWRRRMKASIPLGPSYKLPNLLMKAAYQRLPPGHRKRILRFLHVPLDRYTLAGIRNCIILPDGRSIPKTATMRFIDSREVYAALQHYITELALTAGVPAIAYDYLAWDQRH